MSLPRARLLLPLLAAVLACAAPALAFSTSHHVRRAAHARKRHRIRRSHHRPHGTHRRASAGVPSPGSPVAPPLEAPPAPAPPVAAASVAPADPLAARPLYVEAGSPAAVTESEWARQGRVSEAAAIGKIAAQPAAKWFGDWSYGHGGTAGDVGWWVGLAAASGREPLLVAYDLPWRDCSQYSSGGAASPAAYRSFIDAMAQGIAGRPAAVILEPDALAELNCLASERQAAYYRLLSYAVRTLGTSPATTVYLDAGNANWQPAATMAARLGQADVAGARGFSLNVSNFDATGPESAYGEAIVRDLPTQTHFVIDTSRNGRGAAPGGAWCNPPGRALGASPTARTGSPLLDGDLWIKRPGESDGTCNGGPPAGTWWPAYALELALNAG